MTIRFCDTTEFGFSWVVEEPATRTSHALVHEDRVWLVDPVQWPEATARAAELGQPAGVLQLLDRHNRDCAALAERLEVPHLVVPDVVPASPFEVVRVKSSSRWKEIALWYPARSTLVVAEAIGTNAFFASGSEPAGVHLALRLTPPRSQLGAFAPEHLLVGHGEGLHGEGATAGLHRALDRSRVGLPRQLLGLPGLVIDARRLAKQERR